MTDVPVELIGVFENGFEPLGPAQAALAAAQGFIGRCGQRLVTADEERVVVHLGLGAESSWRPESGHTAMAGLRGLSIDATRCRADRLLSALSRVTDVSSAAEIVDSGLRIALGDDRAPDPGSPPGAEIAAAIRHAQLWTNATAGELGPAGFVDLALRVADRTGLTCTVVSGDELRDRGFGAIHGMGAGSPEPPALIDLRYTPSEPTATVALVGKGVTFDAGGLSLKSAAAMAGMRQDKCGAATVLAVMSALGRLGVRYEVRALLPVVENMIGPRCLRPGDVVTAWDGTRIQVMDTDFEGRVILADALAYAAAEQPGLMVDVATLTYQVITALGPSIGGLFARDDAVAQRLADAAARAGEPLWRLPYDERYLDQVLTADGVRNHPGTDSGRAITAALFLGRFVPAAIPWAHLDITGPAWSGSASDAGATGFGVRTLLTLLRGT